jgi:hypothetical protein
MSVVTAFKLDAGASAAGEDDEGVLAASMFAA